MISSFFMKLLRVLRMFVQMGWDWMIHCRDYYRQHVIWVFLSFPSEWDQDTTKERKSQTCSNMIDNMGISLFPFLCNPFCKFLVKLITGWCHASKSCENQWDEGAFFWLYYPFFIFSLLLLMIAVDLFQGFEYTGGAVRVCYPYVTKGPLVCTKNPSSWDIQPSIILSVGPVLVEFRLNGE